MKNLVNNVILLCLVFELQKGIYTIFFCGVELKKGWSTPACQKKFKTAFKN